MSAEMADATVERIPSRVVGRPIGDSFRVQLPRFDADLRELRSLAERGTLSMTIAGLRELADGYESEALDRASVGVVAFRNVVRGVEGENGGDRRRRTDAEDVPDTEVPSILHEREVAGFPTVDLGADRLVRISDDVDAAGHGDPVDGDGAFHGGSSSVGGSTVAPVGASEASVEAASGVDSSATPDASSGEVAR